MLYILKFFTELAIIFFAGYLLARAFEKVFHVEMNMDMDRKQDLNTSEDE